MTELDSESGRVLKSHFGFDLKLSAHELPEYDLRFFTLKNLDETIDQVFEYVSKLGDQEKLKEVCPYFGVVWPSARGLLEFLRQDIQNLEKIYGHGGIKKGKVLEVGAGLALPSLYLKKNGFQSITVSDFHPDVPLFFRKNVHRNGFNDQDFKFLDLNWVNADSTEKYDLIIGSDILYEREHPAELAKSLLNYVNPSGGRILVADPARPYLQDFVDALSSNAFNRKMIKNKSAVKSHVIRIKDDTVGAAQDWRDIFVIECKVMKD